MRTPRGLWLSIGIGAVSVFRYGTRVRPLPSAPADARELARAGGARGFAATVLVDEQASVRSVTAAIAAAAAELQRGDAFVLSFSGHGLGSRIDGGYQQSWYLFDRPLSRFGPDGIDALLARFHPGVRITILANCCHAGSAADTSIPTPRIRAQVVRISATAAGEITLASADPTRPCEFVGRVLEELDRDGDFSFAYVERGAGFPPFRL